MMTDETNTKRRVAEKLLMPLVAAGTSAAAGYVVKNGPAFVEDTVLPRVRDVVQGAGSATEKLPEKARSAVSSGGELADQLTDRARGVTEPGGASSGGDEDSAGSPLSPEKLTKRTEKRARHRAKRRKATR